MIPVEKEIYIRLVRRICTAVFILVLLLFFNAQVLAETPAEQNADPVSGTTIEESDDFSAVAVQLEAVARDHGRNMADQMLYDSFQAVSAVSAGAYAVPVTGTLHVIAVPEKTEPTFLAWLPYLLVALLAAGWGMIAVLRSRRERSRRVVYKPMRVSGIHSNPYFVYRVQRTYR